MTRVHSPAQQYKEARQIAADYGMYIVDKGGRYTVYRKTPSRPVYLGQRSDAASLRTFVCRCAGVK